MDKTIGGQDGDSGLSLTSNLIDNIIYLIILFTNPFLFSSDIQKAKLLYVIDGDTIIVDLSGKHEKIRLIGIDCPETRNNFKAKRDSEKYNISIDAIILKGTNKFIFLK